MRIIDNIDEMTETARGWLSGGSVGFVPTMGDLHIGQLSLIRAARQECETTVVSIIGRPTSIAGGQDYLLTPQNLTSDLQLLKAEYVDVVFVPHAQDFYPPDFSTTITLLGSGFSELTQKLRAVQDEEHSDSFATAIIKLIQIVRPDVAFFSQKDALQLVVVRRLVRDLNIDISVRILPTVRENDGLAVRNKNAELSANERKAAQVLYKALQAGRLVIASGVNQPDMVEKAMLDVLATEVLVKPDCVLVCQPDTFKIVDTITPGILLFIAVHIGKIQLIDTILWQKDGHWLT